MLIGLVGLKRSGKDTTADYLVQNYGFVKYSFADPIRTLIEEQFGVPVKEQLSRKEVSHPKLKGKTPRQAMRIVGEAYRTVDQDYWINKALAKYDLLRLANPNANFVIADVRLPREFAAILKERGYLWYVDRFPMLPVRSFVHRMFAHETERHLPGLKKSCHTVLWNRDTVDNLYGRIDVFMNRGF